MKPHEFQNVARQFRAGKISLAEFTDKVLGTAGQAATDSDVSQPELLLDQLRDRKFDSHKGDYGRILIVAGSPGMAGAAGLTGIAALRSGAGLVTIATDVRCQATVASFHPALMTVGLPSHEGVGPNERFSQLESLVPRFDCIAIGPGLGQSPSTQQLVRAVITHVRIPLVVDADALNCLGNDFDFEKVNAPLVLTPHPGEMSRMMPNPSSDRAELERFAGELGDAQRVVVLKGHKTLITDGSQSVHNTSGNPGMATAGSGDVLTGIIAAIIGQGLSIWESAVLGCYVHGKAGDAAAKKQSQISTIATDVIDSLPSVFGDPNS